MSVPRIALPTVLRYLADATPWLMHREYAAEAHDELTYACEQFERALDNRARRWLVIGECPVEVEQGRCGGEVRAWPAFDGDDARTSRDARLPRCQSCGTEAAVEWWQAHIVGNPEAKTLVTTDELIGLIAWELGWAVTHEQLRQWKHRERISSAGKDSKGRTLWEHADVIAAIRDDIAEQRARRGVS